MTQETGLKRMLLALPADGASELALDAAVVLARSLKLDIVALLLEDEGGYHAVAYPSAVEFVDVTQERRPTDATRLARDYDLSLRRSERRLRDVAARANMSISCIRVRGRLDRAALADLGQADLLAVFDPPSVLARAFGALSALGREIGTPERVLAVPATPTARRGKVVVLAGRDRAPATMAFAATLARLQDAQLEMWTSDEGSDGAAEAGPPGVVVRSAADLEREGGLRRRLAREARLLIVDPRAGQSFDLAKVIHLARRAHTPILALGPVTEEADDSVDAAAPDSA